MFYIINLNVVSLFAYSSFSVLAMLNLCYLWYILSIWLEWIYF